MADNLDDGEFWLPPQFLTEDDDDDASFDNNNNSISSSNSFSGVKNDDAFDAVSRSLFPHLSSCSETESDEDEQIAELTRQLAHSTLEHDPNKPKGVFGGGSPQSTLSALGSSGKGSSPNGAVSEVNNQTATWDLLRAAAGEVERMRLNENRNGYCYGYGSVSNNNQPKPAPVNVNVNVNHNAGVGLSFYSQQQQRQLQIAQFGMMRQQQMVKQHQQREMVQNRGRNNNNINNSNNNNNNVVRGLSGCAWPPLQNGGGMRPVFPAGKRESTGTGVFLPRCVETRLEPSKKPGCKTVLVPDRVVQALNLNLESVAANGNLKPHNPPPQQQQQRRFNGENGSAVTRVKGGNNDNNYYGFTLQKRNNNNKKNLKPQPQVVNHEIQLPKEWTY